ncbi:hypothetical protein Cni_G10373 [Canna indica]|uniref:Uncharacterized protein n=1 Tax=Canna indica TaxID=4628 RepID=A0AAQ3Q798_9LILI|nr:hypothetical protein Cni_G10373 [Canna indica]
MQQEVLLITKPFKHHEKGIPSTSSTQKWMDSHTLSTARINYLSTSHIGKNKNNQKRVSQWIKSEQGAENKMYCFQPCSQHYIASVLLSDFFKLFYFSQPFLLSAIALTYLLLPFSLLFTVTSVGKILSRT